MRAPPRLRQRPSGKRWPDPGRAPAAAFAALCALWAVRGAAGQRDVAREPYVGHLEICITDPAAGPYVSPLFWANAVQLGVGEAARQLGLTGGRSGQGHALVHLRGYRPAESLWVEQLGGRLGGVTGYPADHYPTLASLRSKKRYGDRKIFTVLVRGLTEDQYRTLHGFLRGLGGRYERYGYGHPNCADLCADAWSKAFTPEIPPGGYWFPVDVGAHVLNLPGKLHGGLALFGKLSAIGWRNRTPDQVRRALRRLGVARRRNRAIGDLSEDEAKEALAE